MGRHRSQAWGKNQRNVKSRGRITQILPTRRLRLEALEDRRLLSLAGVPPLGSLEWIAAASDEPAEAGTPSEIAFSGEAGILTAAPATPDLLAVSDTGVSNIDNLTNLDNSAPEKSLQFLVGNTVAGATVTLYADGIAIGSDVADNATTTVTTNGSFDLVDGPHAITARQTAPGEEESVDSAELEVTIDTVAPRYWNPVQVGAYYTDSDVSDVTLAGTLAYVGAAIAGLEILDVSNPAAPVLVGAFDTPGRANSVTISGTTAYVADGSTGLVIVDVTNPAVPVQLGGYDTIDHAYAVAISGTRAYVADNLAGLVILDVSNPATPVQLGRFDTSGAAFDVAVVGTLAYVADYSTGLEIIDVSKPAAPVRVGGYNTSGSASGVAVSGTTAYVADANWGMVILDVSRPAAPAELGRLDTSGWACGVAISGTVAYVADGGAGLQIIDVTNPAKPVRLHGYDTAGSASGVAVSGTLAYVADGAGGLAVIDLLPPSLPPTPGLQAASDTGASNTDNITGDNTPTFDVGLPAGSNYRMYRDGIQISGDYETGATFTAPIQPDGTYAYTVATADAAGNASTPSAALSVTIDSSIPSAPDLVTVSDTGVSNSDDVTNLDNSGPDKTLQFSVGGTIPGATVSIFADGVAIGSAVADGATTIVTTNGSLDMADGVRTITARQTIPGRQESPDSAGLTVTIDTVAPIFSNPVLAGRSDTLGIAYDVAVSGTTVYVADDDKGLQIFDVTNPAAPALLGALDTGGRTYAVVVVGTVAYLADGDGGLVIVDVANPAVPMQLGAYDTAGIAWDVAVSGTLAYVADYDVGLTIIDVANPSAPRRLGGCDTDGLAYGVTVSGGLAYVADGDAGLAIVDVSDPAAPVRLGTYNTSGYARDVAVTGPSAYVADDAAGLVIIDVVNPSEPVVAGRFDTSKHAYGVAVVGTVAYVADLLAGLVVLDVSHPGKPLQLGLRDTSGGAEAVAVSGSLAYVADASSGLTILDTGMSVLPPAPDLDLASDSGISNTDNLTADATPTFSLAVPNGMYFRAYRDGVQISGDFVAANYFTAPVQADGTAGYTIVAADAAGNASPVSAALAVTVDTTIPGTVDLVAAFDTGTSSTDNLTNLDNSAPEKSLQFTVRPTIPGAMVTLYSDGKAIGSAVAAAGSITTVTTNGSLDLADGKRVISARQTSPGRPESADSAGLTVTIDTVAYPIGNPVRVGGFDTRGSARNLVLSGTLAYVADYAAGLAILDISDPARPVPVGGYDTMGSASDVAVVGTRAYVADAGGGLEIIDVADPAAPVRLGGYSTSGSAVGVTVVGSLAYVAAYTAGLQIIDVTDPAAPTRLGGYDTSGAARSVTVVGTLAYVADYSGGLVIVDVSDPAAPALLGTYKLSGYAYDVALSGTLAYVAYGNIGLVIVDVSNSAAPALLGKYRTMRDAYGVALAGTIACVAEAGYSGGLQIIDATNPTAPVLMTGVETSGLAYGVAVSGSLAYVAADTAGVEIFDTSPAPDLQQASDTALRSTDNITTDTTPTFSVPLPTGSAFRFYRDGVQISKDRETNTTYTTAPQVDGTYRYSFATLDAAGNVSALFAPLVVTIDTSIPPAPDLLPVSDTGSSPTDNLTTLDNSQPDRTLQFTIGSTVAGATVSIYAEGVLLGSAVAVGATTTVTTNGTFDLADGVHSITARQTLPGHAESGDSLLLRVTIDTVAPFFLNPVWLTKAATGGGAAYDVAVLGTVAYVAGWDVGLVILDVANPAKPVLLNTVSTGGLARAVAVSGTVAYVAADNVGLVIIDVSDPADPVRLGGYSPTPPPSGVASAWGVAVSGTTVYLASRAAGLEIIDVSNPAAPMWLGRYDTPGYANNVAVVGTRAYVADDDYGIHILDVSNPAAPARLGGYDTSQYAYDVTLSGPLAYVADYGGGLVILDVTDPAAPVKLSAFSTNGSARGVVLSGTTVFVASEAGGLAIVDVTNPAAPTRIGGYDSLAAMGVAVSETLAYVANGRGGLDIIDLGLHASPPAPDLQPASDTGASPADNITSDTTPTFDLPGRAGWYFRVYRDGIQISGNYSSGTAYTAPAQADGTYSYTFAIVDAAGNLAPQSPPLAVTIDTRPPAVANLVVGGSGWTGDFLADLNAANGQDIGGYSIPVGSGAQLAPLPWANIDQIRVVFSENVSVDKDDLALTGANTASYDLAGATFSYDPATFTATWKLADALAADTLELRLNADTASPIQDIAGNRLDGEWTNPASPADTGTDTYPSGNGAAGGDFVFRFRVLPCDANQDGAVDIFDVAKLQANFSQDHGMMPADGDFDGNGTVDIFDVALLQVAFGGALDPPSPATRANDEASAADDPRLDIGLSGAAGTLTAAPGTPDLLAVSDTGASSTDDITSLDNGRPDQVLQFAVGNTIAGATVTLYANARPIGSAVAGGETTTITTKGSLDLADGTHAITARQTMPGEAESADSATLSLTIDTVSPGLNPLLVGALGTSEANDVVVVGTLAYIAAGSAGLVIADISDPAAPKLLGSYDTWGANDLAVFGTTAYVADGPAGLVIIDVTNPSAPARLGAFDTSHARIVAVSGTVAYLADVIEGLILFDVANPATPVRKGAINVGAYAEDVTVSGKVAYMADGSAGLQIIDVTNPAAPVRMSTVDTSGYSAGVAVVGNLAYVADDGAGLAIIDVTNPAAPVRKGVIDTGGSARGVAVSGNLAYVADATAGLAVYDVADPAAPVRLGVYDTSGAAYGVAAFGTLVCVADGAAGLAIIDVNPSPDLQSASDTGPSSSDNITGDNTPTFDLSVPAGSYFRFFRDGVQISGDYESGDSYTAAVQPDGTHDYAVAAVDAAGNVSRLSSTVAVTFDDTIPWVDLLAVSDTGISNADDVTSMDNSRPDKVLQFAVGNTVPGATVTLYADGTVIGSAVAAGPATTFTTNGRDRWADGVHALTATQTMPGGLEWRESGTLRVIVDTTVPCLAQVKLGTLDTGGIANDVVLSGTLAYVADGNAGLAIIDVTNPTAPIQLGALDTGGSAYGVAVSDLLVYVADGDAGLAIVDVSNPASPVLLGRFDTSGSAYDVVVSGTLAYVADNSAGLVIIDVTNPAAPVRLGGYDTDGAAGGVFVVGTLAYVADGGAGLVVIDVANPAAPTRLGGCDTSGTAYSVAIAGRTAYVADGGAGLQILDVTNPATPVQLGEYHTSGQARDVFVSGTLAYVTANQPGWNGYLEIIEVGNPAATLRSGYYSTDGSFYGVTVSETLAYVTNGSYGLMVLDTAPSLPGWFPDLQPASDTGHDNTDNLTGNNTPTFEFNVPTGFYYRFYRDGVQISGDFETGTSRTTFTTPVLADGTSDYAYAGVDAAGNVSILSRPLTVTVDHWIPSAPELVAASDTGVSSTDRLTNLDNSAPDKAIQFLVGNTTAGATVTIYADGVAIGTAIAHGPTTTVTTNGRYDLADGTHVFAATQTRPAGPESTKAATVRITVDTVGPVFWNPVRLTQYDTAGCAYAVTVVGTLAYVADDTAGMQIFDVANSSVPVRLGGYDTAGWARDVVVSGTLAYVADGPAGLVILDVTNPAAPVELGASDTAGYAYGVVVAGNRAYVADERGHLAIIDVTDPAAPVRLGGLATAGYARGVAVSGTTVYLADDVAGLQIIDASDPAAPLWLGEYKYAANAKSVAVSGTLAYVASDDDGLMIIDVSNPAKPVRVGSHDPGGNTWGVAISGMVAYLAAGPAGLVILDVNNPGTVRRLHGYDTPGYAFGVAVWGNVAYVADGAAGLEIIELSRRQAPDAPDLQPGSDTGASPTDNITNDTTPTFDVAVPAGCSFRVYRDGVQISGDFETGASYTAPVQPDGTHAYTVAAVDAAGNVSAQGSPLAVTIDAPPAVVEAIVNGGAAQRSAIASLAIRFSEDVLTTWDAGDLTLVNRDSGAAVDLTGVTPVYDAATHTATWNLAGAALDDGYYVATLLAAGIADATGNPLAGGDYAFSFFRLLGDTNGNASVDIFDVAKLQVNYGQTTGMTPAEGDFDGNGTVDVFDVALLQVAYGRTLDLPAPAPAAAPTAEALDWADPKPLLSAMPSAANDLAEAIVMARVSRPTACCTRLPLVAARGRTLSGKVQPVAEAFGGRVSGPPRVHAASRPMQPVAVRHAVENASWESAVDRLLESDELELTR
ncbi:MAG: Ig-like domain-containing protein [Pirellulales bacterium]